MKLRTTLLILLAICVATTAFAGDKMASKTGPARLSGVEAQRLFQGFEGDFPPAGWTLSSVNGHVAPENFYKGDSSNGTPIEGNHLMVCEWDPDLVDQDNKIEFDYPITAGEDNLNFFISGSLTWLDNYDLAVEIDGIEVYSWQDMYGASEDWEYEFVNIDLTAHIGTTVNIAFRYTGNDGAASYIDAMMIDDGTGWEPPPPPPAPLNDTCVGAMTNDFYIESGAFSYASDNTWANHDYSLVYDGSCTGYSFSGLDVVWVVCMEQGDVLNVEMTDTSFDASMYLMTDCADPQGSCVAGADDPEIISYTAAADGTYYLVCGGYSSGVGPFTIVGNLEGEGCGPVATEDTNWGNLKSLYR